MQPAPDFIGPFEIRGKLGRGAMAVVWRGYDPVLEREVAIKEPLPPPDSSAELRAEFALRFVREARAAARLNHPGIVRVYSVGTFDDRAAIIMELVEGPTLRDVLRLRQLTTSQTYSLLEQLLRAVAYAHEHGVIHRDLKPDNVFVTADGSIRLADFGIAQLATSGTMILGNLGQDAPALTRCGTMLGTPAYMAPERIRGECVDARCDVFALGVIAYECMAGVNPFGSETSTHFATIIHRIINEPTPPLHLEDDAAGPLANVVMRALNKVPANRFENAGAMLAAWRAAFPAYLDPKAELRDLASVCLPATSAHVLETSDGSQHDLLLTTALDGDSNPAAARQAASKRRTRMALLLSLVAVALVALIALALTSLPSRNGAETADGATLASQALVLDSAGVQLSDIASGYAAVLAGIQNAQRVNAGELKKWHDAWSHRLAAYKRTVTEVNAYNRAVAAQDTAGHWEPVVGEDAWGNSGVVGQRWVPGTQGHRRTLPKYPKKPGVVDVNIDELRTGLAGLKATLADLSRLLGTQRSGPELGLALAAVDRAASILDQRIEETVTALNDAVEEDKNGNDVFAKASPSRATMDGVSKAMTIARASLFEAVGNLGLDQSALRWASGVTRTVGLPAHRGAIVDRNGVMLALSVPRETVYATPRLLDNPATATAQLCTALRITDKKKQLALRRALSNRDSGFAFVARKVAPDLAAAALLLRIPGVGTFREETRAYPQKGLATQVVGLVGVDNRGLAGLELQYDEKLAGKQGTEVTVLDVDGSTMHTLSRIDPVAGNDVRLTIDSGIQRKAEDVLSAAVRTSYAKGGVAVVMDPKTGQILAMANAPVARNRMVDTAPYLNRSRVVTDIYDPGSLFKVVTIAGALADGVVTQGRQFTLPPSIRVADRVVRDRGRRGTVTYSVTEILQWSSNIGAVRIGQWMGPERLSKWVNAFGFGQKTGIDFPHEASGVVPPLEEWSPSCAATVPMGQGLSVTPLQMAIAFCAIANDGMAVTPRLVMEAGEGGAQVTTGHEIIPASVAQQMRQMLATVVDAGTGSKGGIAGYGVAGKTGTSRKAALGGGHSSTDYVASFTAMVPADDPELVVLVAVDEPRTSIYGGEIAAPAVEQIIRYAIGRLEIAPPG